MRPKYTSDLFNDIIRFVKLDNNKKVLEIGIGTGQATLPFLNTGCNITAIELGKDLANFSQRKFSRFKNIKIINSDFINFNDNEDTYDLIYSATALHWIPKEIGYPKVYNFLKSGGVLALFWNHPYPETAIQKIYDIYTPDFLKPKKLAIDNEHCLSTIRTIKDYGFIKEEYKLYYSNRKLNAEQYIALMNTYSSHRSMEKDSKEILENGIIEAIKNNGNQVIIYDTIDLYLSKKP